MSLDIAAAFTSIESYCINSDLGFCLFLFYRFPLNSFLFLFFVCFLIDSKILNANVASVEIHGGVSKEAKQMSFSQSPLSYLF